MERLLWQGARSRFCNAHPEYPAAPPLSVSSPPKRTQLRHTPQVTIHKSPCSAVRCLCLLLARPIFHVGDPTEPLLPSRVALPRSQSPRCFGCVRRGGPLQTHHTAERSVACLPTGAVRPVLLPLLRVSRREACASPPRASVTADEFPGAWSGSAWRSRAQLLRGSCPAARGSTRRGIWRASTFRGRPGVSCSRPCGRRRASQ